MLTYEYENKKQVSEYGGSRIEVNYLLKHENHGRVNQYRITCAVRGIESLDPHIDVVSAEWLGDMETESNDETLTEEGIINLFEEKYL